MIGLKTLIASIFFVVGLSGNELWGYDLSNIIGNEEAIHITVDPSGNDVSGSDLSGNEFYIQDDFDQLADTSLWGNIKRFWNHCVNGFFRVVNVLRDGTKSVEGFHRAMARFNDDLDAMIARDRIGKINFNPFIAMIRWVTGDLIFYEIYIVFALSISLVWLKVSMIVIEFLRGWTSSVARLYPPLMDNKLFKWLFYRHL